VEETLMDGLSRRTVLLGALGASAVGLSSCAKPPVTVARPTVSPTGPVASQLQQLMTVYGTNTDQLGLWVKDLTSGRDWNFRGDYASQSASMVKVMIAAMALRQARRDGEELSFENMTRLSKALVDSDNDAADELWAYAGGADAYQRLANELQMTGTRRDENRPDWSWTWTTPQDQVVLLDKLLHGTTALTDADRLYLLDVMRKTNPAQIWGIGTRRGGDVQVQTKNGWVQFKSSDGLWAVNSMGHVEGAGRDYLAAAMCRVATFETGKALLDAIGGDLFKIMGTGRI